MSQPIGFGICGPLAEENSPYECAECGFLCKTQQELDDHDCCAPEYTAQDAWNEIMSEDWKHGD